MQAKRIRESAVTLAQVMNPQDANPAGNVHGGVIMKLIDTAAGAAAIKHAGLNCVTASIDRLDFHNPVFIGDLVTLRASINYTARAPWRPACASSRRTSLPGKRGTPSRPT